MTGMSMWKKVSLLAAAVLVTVLAVGIAQADNDGPGEPSYVPPVPHPAGPTHPIPHPPPGESLPVRPPGGTATSPARSPKDFKPCPPPGGEPDFARYRLGGSFEGHALEKTTRVCQKTPVEGAARPNFVEFIYGTCDPKGYGCAPPLAIQNYPACERNRAMYGTPYGPLPRRDLRVRGVTAALYDSGTRLELYTGETTVVIFGFSGEDQLSRAAKTLRPEPGSPGAAIGEDLPAPKTGVLDGTIPCS